MAIEFTGKLEDLLRIQKNSADHGWLLDIKEANDLWYEYSKTRDHSWIDLPESKEDLWEIISDNMYCE